jgi:hypothetical protein
MKPIPFILLIEDNEQDEILTIKALKKNNVFNSKYEAPRFTNDEEEKIKRMIEIWENGDVPSNDTKNILKSIKNVADGVEAYHKIVSQVDDKYFAGRKQVASRAEGEEKQVILSCYMKGAKN